MIAVQTARQDIPAKMESPVNGATLDPQECQAWLDRLGPLGSKEKEEKEVHLVPLVLTQLDLILLLLK